MSRGLALPAVVCLALGAVLGVWGWGQRDEARARIVPEEQVIEQGGIFAPGPVDEAQRLDQACASLRAASRVERPFIGDVGVAGEVPASDPADPAAAGVTGFILAAVLTPDLVVGLPGLDRPDVRTAIDDERRAVDVVVASGGDVTVDPDVARTAAVLGLAIDGTC